MSLLICYMNLWLMIPTLGSIASLALVKGGTADPLLLWLRRANHGRRVVAVIVLMAPTLLSVIFYPNMPLIVLSAFSDLAAVFVIGGKLDRVLYRHRAVLLN